jgi:hypothetical protein
MGETFRGWWQDSEGKWRRTDEHVAVPAPNMRRSRWPLVLIALVIGVVIAIGANSDDHPSDEPAKVVSPATELDRKLDAFTACKNFVKSRLKAPASAKFRNPNENDGEVQIAGSGTGPYVVASTVDSQNSFGALLRSDFTCKVTLVGGSWRLDDIAVT